MQREKTLSRNLSSCGSGARAGSLAANRRSLGPRAVSATRGKRRDIVLIIMKDPDYHRSVAIVSYVVAIDESIASSDNPFADQVECYVRKLIIIEGERRTLVPRDVPDGMRAPVALIMGFARWPRPIALLYEAYFK